MAIIAVFLIFFSFSLSGCASALHKSACRGDARQVAALLDGGADPNSTSAMPTCGLIAGATPLWCAAARGYADAARALVQKGAAVDYEIRRPGGVLPGTPLILASRRGHEEVIKVLLDSGADLSKTDADGATAIAAALRAGHAGAVALLERAQQGSRASPAQARTPAMSGTPQSEQKSDSKALDREEMRRMMREVVQAAVREHDTEHPPVHAPKSDLTQPRYRMPEDGDSFAVVVGIENYSALPPARFAERDAADMAEHFSAMGVPRRNIVHLSGAQATLTGMKKYLQAWLPKNVKPSSRIYFYFSGHGAPDASSGKAYLVPWDGDPNYLSESAYPLSQLYDDLGRLGASSVVAALDACFSGAGGRSVLAKGARPLVTMADAGAAWRDKVTLLTAAAGNEITSTIEEQEHGMFTYFLLKGLNGEAKDAAGRVTVKGLYDYLKPRVQDEARRQNREQTPTLRAAQDTLLRL